MFLKETLRLCCWKFSLFNGPWWKPWSSIHNCPGSIWNGMDLRLSAHNQTPKWITPGEVHKISVAGARLAPSSRNVPVLPHPYTHSNGVPLYSSRKIHMFIKPLIKKLNRMHMSYRSEGCWKKKTMHLWGLNVSFPEPNCVSGLQWSPVSSQKIFPRGQI